PSKRAEPPDLSIRGLARSPPKWMGMVTDVTRCDVPSEVYGTDRLQDHSCSAHQVHVTFRVYGVAVRCRLASPPQRACSRSVAFPAPSLAFAVAGWPSRSSFAR